MNLIVRTDGTGACLKELVGEYEISIAFDNVRPFYLDEDVLASRNNLINTNLMIWHGDNEVTNTIIDECFAGFTGHSVQATLENISIIHNHLKNKHITEVNVKETKQKQSDEFIIADMEVIIRRETMVEPQVSEEASKTIFSRFSYYFGI